MADFMLDDHFAVHVLRCGRAVGYFRIDREMRESAQTIDRERREQRPEQEKRASLITYILCARDGAGGRNVLAFNIIDCVYN